jgi:hypothetical protein
MFGRGASAPEDRNAGEKRPAKSRRRKDRIRVAEQ